MFRLPFAGAAGETVIVAITSQNRRVAEVTLADEIDTGVVQHLLEILLDEVDPQPPTSRPMLHVL